VEIVLVAVVDGGGAGLPDAVGAAVLVEVVEPVLK